ncbi:hypothetical protein ACRALDRAFT_1065611 [Sodiomyces alcalophilus JCM 7366]|uniref:uncharacterized protein n=1 Tax=Sodiomyces alcalophilus JCM 7366 TaxID=591952 RepID=UPI0039B5D128
MSWKPKLQWSAGKPQPVPSPGKAARPASEDSFIMLNYDLRATATRGLTASAGVV